MLWCRLEKAGVLNSSQPLQAADCSLNDLDEKLQANWLGGGVKKLDARYLKIGPKMETA